jgi:hypothetical protein
MFIDLQTMDQIRKMERPTDVPDTGLLCDLLWADPDKDTDTWGENDRGVSFMFGAATVAKFLDTHDLDLVCRAHQVFLFSFYFKIFLNFFWGGPYRWWRTVTSSLLTANL